MEFSWLPMSEVCRDRSAIRSLTEKCSQNHLENTESATSTSRNWAGDEKQRRIRAIQLGATLPSAVMPTIWRRRNSTRASSGLSISSTESGPAAIMCAEAVWWRCHRALISDYLKVRGVDVMHILDASKSEPHPFTPAAHVADGSLSYASERDR